MSDALDQFHDDYGVALRRLAKAVAELERAEEARKSLFSELVVEASKDGTAIGKAEHIARASFDYRAASEAVAVARHEKEDAAGNVEWLKTRWETWRSRAANARADKMMEAGR